METAELEEIDPSRWDGLLERLGVTDAYYTRGYLEASAELADATPRLLHLGTEGGDVIFACLERRDPVDLITPYGYGGPLPLGDDPPAEAFAQALSAWCERKGAVSSFLVHHPVYGTHAHPTIPGQRTTPLTGTVGWRLQGDLEANMHKHHRRLVRRARAQGLQVTVDPAPADLREFVALYEAAMRRMDAERFYLFPEVYWRALAGGVPLVRVDVRRDGELLAGLLGMGAPPHLHYHLGALAEAGRSSGAPQLAMLALATWGREHGYAILHLGGGVGGRDDSLMQYKRRFDPGGQLEARIGKAVHDPEAYARLTGRPGIDWDGYFPAYRSKTS